MSMTNAAEQALLDLIFTNVDWANIGDAGGLQNSATAGRFYISLHTASLPQYVSEQSAHLNALLSDAVDAEASPVAAMDVSLFLCNAADCLSASSTGGLSPSQALKVIQKISPNIEFEKETSAMSSVNKYTVSHVLSKYSFSAGVEPAFIQSMFTYLRKNDVTVPETAVNLTFKACNEIVASRVGRVAIATVNVNMYVCMHVALLYKCIHECMYV